MKNNFDDQLKNKWNDFHFTVDADHRSAMNDLLDQQRKPRGGFIWWFSGIVLIAAVSGMLLFTSGKQVSEIEKNTSNSQSKEMANSISGGKVSNENHPHLNSKNDVARENNSSSPNNVINALSKPNHIATNSQAADVLNNQNANNFGIAAKAKPGISFSLNKDTNTNTSLKGRNSSQSTISLSNTAVEKSITNDVNIIDLNKPTDNELLNNDLSEEISNASIESELAIAAPVQREAYLTEELEVVQIKPLTYTRDNMMPVIPQLNLNNPIHLFVESGIGYIPSTLPEVKPGISITAGAGIGYKIADKTELLLSGGYIFQKEGFAFERSSTVYQPGFGARSNLHYLAPDKLHFVYSKLGLQQHFKRHIIAAHIGMQWLYGAQGNITVQTEDQLSGTLAPVENYDWLVLDGMQRFIWTAELAYGYQINSKLSLHLGLKYNISPLRRGNITLDQLGYDWKGRFAPYQPSFTIKYRFYGN